MRRSVDNGTTIKWDQEFHDLLMQAAKKLNGREGKVADAEGAEFTLCTPVECKVSPCWQHIESPGP